MEREAINRVKPQENKEHMSASPLRLIFRLPLTDDFFVSSTESRSTPVPGAASRRFSM